MAELRDIRHMLLVRYENYPILFTEFLFFKGHNKLRTFIYFKLFGNIVQEI